MRRPAGVTAVAILSFLGSLFTFAMAAFMGVIAILTTHVASLQTAAPPRLPQAQFKAVMLVGMMVYVVPAIWGIVTSIGLWRLKNWARISAIIFSVLLGFGGVFLLIGTAFAPFPTTPQPAQTPQIVAATKMIMGAMALSATAIALWWLIYFNLHTVRAQFAGSVSSAPSLLPVEEPSPLQQPDAPVALPGRRRPVSMTAIAVLLLVGAACSPIALWMHSPLMLCGSLLQGFASVAWIGVFTIINVYIGIGLLKLWPQARIAGIAYFLFAIVNTSLSFLRSGSADRFRQMMMATQQRTIFGQTSMMYGQTSTIVYPQSFLVVMGVASILITLVPLYFLVTRKAAFDRPVS